MARDTKVITISSLKGGVGKTTLTSWFAGIYSGMEYKVLILDADFYTGGIACSLNLKVKKDIYDLHEALYKHKEVNIKNYITRYSKNIDVISCPKDPRLAGKISIQYMKTIIEQLKLLYDIILIDTNHLLTDMNVVLLDCTDITMYLVTNDPICLKNTKSMVSIYKEMKKDNYVLVYNEAVHPKQHIFSKLDMKVMLKDNIDFVIPKSLYNKRIDTYLMDGVIPTMDRAFRVKHYLGIEKLEVIANYLLKGK